MPKWPVNKVISPLLGTDDFLRGNKDVEKNMCMCVCVQSVKVFMCKFDKEWELG